ncbi:DUF4179 domain-containing protein [Bacillus horti]|uniref:DUF4179 domain-containing protein n=1 Tax=Caldalkalibacillus horti TaxID=77523 RepID=A0ABT9VZ79_9BACI|nr:DUF4179 domain-containing protein [Bacillus horti]MDQ0166300.1 hypothetical protein [Bacillus horti]
MNKLEQHLAEEKKRRDSIKAPEELEGRLRNALLNQAPAKKRNRFGLVQKLAVVALLFIIVTVSYHYNAFAFYGKQLLGFDELLTSTLKQLNEEGMGQPIEKQMLLEDDTVLTINRVMTDANQLILYYTLANPNGIDEFAENHFRPSRITGFLTNSQIESGTSLMNEEQTELIGTMFFEPVNPFAKTLTLHFWQNEQMDAGEISFPYAPNKALQTQLKQSINKKLNVDKGSITFKSIIATPTVTVVNGTLSVDNFNRVPYALGGVELRANGVPIESIGSGSQSRPLGGFKIDIRFDTLPKQLDSLELVLKEFAGYQPLEEKIPLTSLGEQSIEIAGKELWVKQVSTTSQGVEITIATDEDVLLDGVAIETKDGLVPIQTTVNQVYMEDGNGRELKERTLVFETTDEPSYLFIEGMHYMKSYNRVIHIPVTR